MLRLLANPRDTGHPSDKQGVAGSSPSAPTGTTRAAPKLIPVAGPSHDPASPSGAPAQPQHARGCDTPSFVHVVRSAHPNVRLTRGLAGRM
jgi:hypothetical protein